MFALSLVFQTRMQTTACLTFTQPHSSQCLDVFNERLHDKVVRKSEDQPKKFQTPQKCPHCVKTKQTLSSGPELLETILALKKYLLSSSSPQ